MNALFPAEPVLIVDDEAAIRSTVRMTLLLAGITNVVECEDGNAAAATVKSRSFACMVLDLVMPGISGQELLALSLEERPETPVIVATGIGDVETAVTCMRAGAFDYLVKPIDRTRLVTTVRHAVERWETAREVDSLKQGLLSADIADPDAFSAIITRDATMRAVFKYAEAIAPTSLPVLITGETGVGKELFARAMHSLSGRDGAFVPVNVAGLDDTLFSDTLFGHVKGAYTGADAAREGMVAKAEGGTLFLDEIGDLAAESQIKLLRLLQEREYYPLGTDRPRPSNARFVFATNLDVTGATDDGRFRKDLLYRLKSHHIRIPSLRERMEDLPLLVDHFFDKASAELGKSRPTSPKELLPLLRSYSFPGNIRELEGMIYDAVVRHESRTMSLDSFREAIGSRSAEALALKAAGGDALRSNAQVVRPAPAAKPGTGGGGASGPNPFSGYESLPTLHDASEYLIEEALRRANGNQAIAARTLGLTRTALNRRLNRNP